MATVSEIVFDALPKLNKAKPTGTTLYQAINFISTMLTKRLMNRKSDLVKTSEMTLTVTPDDIAYDLPSGFLSLAEKPFIGSTELDPLQEHRATYDGVTALEPRKYNLLGTQIEFYPELDSTVTSVTVKARYYAMPTAVSGPTQVVSQQTVDVNIPFNTLFDQIYYQGVPRVVAKGLSVIQADADFERFITTEVDAVLASRVSLVPDRRTKRSNFL